MRSAGVIATGLLAVLLAGCNTPRGHLVLDKVGPQDPRGSVSRGSGQLQVFSESQQYNSGGIFYYVHTPYWVYSTNGTKVRAVQNHVGETDSAPMRILLPAGEYHVIARAERYGLVTIPTIIEGNRLTQIFLDGAGLPGAKAEAPSKLVFLPGGPAIGFRAVPPPSPVKKPGGG
jgi:hypothetical protein